MVRYESIHLPRGKGHQVPSCSNIGEALARTWLTGNLQVVFIDNGGEGHGYLLGRHVVFRLVIIVGRSRTLNDTQQ
jgi:hypothetical protein